MKVVYSSQAKSDLHEIYDYITFSLLSPENASNTINRIMATVRSLDTMPKRNPLYQQEPWQSKGVRFVTVRNYMIFYTINESSDTISIVRIIYGGRDVKNQLENTKW